MNTWQQINNGDKSLDACLLELDKIDPTNKINNFEIHLMVKYFKISFIKSKNYRYKDNKIHMA